MLSDSNAIISIFIKGFVSNLQDGDEIIIQNGKIENLMNKLTLLVDKWSRIMHIPVKNARKIM
jgi:acylphosphatase